jgi:signal transduction histidine kinase
MFREKKDFINARKYYLKSDSINKATFHDEVHGARLMMRLAKLSLLEGNIKEVGRLFPQLKKAFLLENDQNYKLTWLWVLKDISHALGKTNEELFYQGRYYTLEDSAKEGGKKIADPRAEFERLENKYRTSSLVNERQYRKTLGKMILFITGCVVTLLSVIFFREMKLRRLLIEKEKKETGKLKETLFLQEMHRQEEQDEVISKQRRQISADLHDELSSSLAALKYFVEDMKKKATGAESKKLLEEIEGETGSIYQNARAYMHSLQKYTTAEQYDVVKFLDNISREFAAKKLLYINPDIDRENLQQQLTAYQQDQFYHIVKESISNIIRNTQAGRIDIRVQFHEGNCYFMIKDDGAGVKKTGNVYESGLTRVRKIMNEIGGHLRVQPGNKGTILDGYFPAE